MEDKLSIKLSIAGVPYPLRINREEEERYRKAAKLIDQKLLQYKQLYKDSSEKDFLAMVSLHFATNYLLIEESADQTLVNNKLDELNETLLSHIDNIIPAFFLLVFESSTL